MDASAAVVTVTIPEEVVTVKPPSSDLHATLLQTRMKEEMVILTRTVQSSEPGLTQAGTSNGVKSNRSLEALFQANVHKSTFVLI